MECHTTLERVARMAKEKCTKDSDSNPSAVGTDVLEFSAIGAGEWASKESQCWFEQEYSKNNPPQDPLQRDIREWSNPAMKGQGHNPVPR